MPIRAVIFDLDGTLLDTLADLSGSANEVLESLGFPTHEQQAYRRFIGDGVEMLFRRALPEGADNEQNIAACRSLFTAVYGKRWNDQTRLYEGIPETLDALASDEVAINVLSNKPHAATLRCAEEYLSRWPFACILGHREGTPHKPDPFGVQEILLTLGVDRREALYVGDSNTDMRTAVNAGVAGIGVEWGFRDRAELMAEGASHVISHPSELLQLIDELAG